MTQRSAFLLLGALLLGCGSSSPGAASDAGTDPGPDGPVSGLFNGQRINFTSDGFSLYTKAQNRTTIGAGIKGDAASSDMKVTILVPGNMPGQFACDPSLTVAITFDQYDATYSTTGQSVCTVTIDRYGAVGGNVSGTFSGTLSAIQREGNPPPPAQVTVTGGTFTVVRAPDQ